MPPTPHQHDNGLPSPEPQGSADQIIADLLRERITEHLLPIASFLTAALPHIPFHITLVARGPTPDTSIIVSNDPSPEAVAQHLLDSRE